MEREEPLVPETSRRGVGGGGEGWASAARGRPAAALCARPHAHMWPQTKDSAIPMKPVTVLSGISSSSEINVTRL